MKLTKMRRRRRSRNTSSLRNTHASRNTSHVRLDKRAQFLVTMAALLAVVVPLLVVVQVEMEMGVEAVKLQHHQHLLASDSPEEDQSSDDDEPFQGKLEEVKQELEDHRFTREAAEHVRSMYALLTRTRESTDAVYSNASMVCNKVASRVKPSSSQLSKLRNAFDHLYDVDEQVKQGITTCETLLNDPRASLTNNNSVNGSANTTTHRNTDPNAPGEITKLKKVSYALKNVRNEIATIIGETQSGLDVLDKEGPEGLEDAPFCKESVPKIYEASSNIKHSSLEEYPPPTSHQIFNYVLATLLLLISLMLLACPPTYPLLIVSAILIYSYGLLWWGITFLSYELSQPYTIIYNWWKVELAAYGVGIAGGLLAALPLLFLDVDHVFILIMIGVAFGIVFGVQMNAMGLFLIPQDVVYFSLACAVGGAAGLFGLVYMIIGLTMETSPRPAISFVQCWIGAYGFFKAIGVLSSTFPLEISRMSLDAAYSNTIGYFCASVIVAISVFVVHWFMYKPQNLPYHGRPSHHPSHARKDKRQQQQRSSGKASGTLGGQGQTNGARDASSSSSSSLSSSSSSNRKKKDYTMMQGPSARGGMQQPLMGSGSNSTSQPASASAAASGNGTTDQDRLLAGEEEPAFGAMRARGHELSGT